MKSLRQSPIRWMAVGLVLLAASAGLWAYASYDIQRSLRHADRSLTIDGDAVEAERLARRVLLLDSDHAEGLVILGAALNLQERFAEAIEAYRRVPPESEFHAEAAYGASACLMLKGRYTEAEQLLESLMESHPDFDQGRELLGKLYTRTFRAREAARLKWERYQRHPDDLLYLPEVLKASFVFPSGLGIENELVELDRKSPGEPCLVAALGRAFWLQGNIDRADQYFTELLGVPDASVRGVTWAARFWLETGNQDRAVEAVKLAESLVSGGDDLSSETQISLWFLRAAIARRDNRFQEAEQSLTEAIGLCPYCPEPRSRRAAIRRQLGDKTGAAKDTRQAMRLGNVSEELSRLAVLIGKGQMSVPICEGVADLLAEQGRDDFSAAWRRLADVLQRRRF